MTEPTFRLNGKPVPLPADPQRRLISLLRDGAGLLGPREGCGIGRCGTCLVLIDGRPVNACLVFAGRLAGRSVVTAEGLGPEADDIRAALADEGAIQCGYCTPGLLIALHAALSQAQGEEDVAHDLIGQLCRCTGYGGHRRVIARLVRERTNAAG